MKNLFNVIAMIFSIFILVVGFNTINDTMWFGISGISFGADFYTEIYEEVEQVRGNIIGIKNSVNKGFGYTLCTLGVFGFCSFGNNILNNKKEKVKNQQ